MNFLTQVQKDLKEAQLARNEIKVGTLRLLLSELNYARIAKGEDLTEQEFISVVQKELKKRKEAAEAFKGGGRAESAEKEETEGKILEVYLPSQLSDEELTKIVEEVISEACQLALVTDSEKPSLQDMGRIIRLVMDKVRGQADGVRVSWLVKEKLKDGN